MKRSAAGRWQDAVLPATAGLALRVAFILWTSPLELAHDESRFWDLATGRMAGTGFLPPLYPFFLAAVRALVGDDVMAVRLFGACLSITSIVLVQRLAERHLGPGEGKAPAWFAALLPTLVYYDGRIRGESLTALLLLLVAWLWTGPAPGAPRRIVATGFALGLLALVRPEFLLLPPILVILDAVARRPGIPIVRRAALLLPGLILVLAPWIVRNHSVIGTWTPVSANGGYNFWKSSNASTDGSQVPIEDYSLWEGVPEGQMDRLGYSEGWRYIRAHPWRSLALAPARLGHLFGPERDFLSDIRRAHFPARARGLDISLALIQNAAWALLLSVGLFALLGPRRSTVKEFALAVLLNLVLVHLVFFGDDRFHVPLAPLLCIALPEAWDGSLRTRAATRALILALAGEGIVWVYILLRDLGRVASLWGA